MTLPTLPDPNFIERDPQAIEQACFARWEELGGEPLSPASPEAMLIHVIAYRETTTRIAVNEAAKQNLLRFARFPMLDFLGELVGVQRLAPQKAITTLEFTLPAVHGSPVLIAAGTRRKTRDGKVTFETTADITIPAGELTRSISASATDAGAHGNGYVAGQVSVGVDPLPLDATATNTTTTAGGDATESDARFLERILLAPDAFSTAGPSEAYRFHALGVGSVRDVAVLSPEPGEIQIAVLGDSGPPESEVLDLVEAKLSAEDIRPMSDEVEAVACTQVNWALEVELTLYADADGEQALELALAEAETYRLSRVTRLGRDLVPSEVTARLRVYGVYDLDVIEPAFTELAEDEWANCTGVAVSVAGYASERLGVQVV